MKQAEILSKYIEAITNGMPESQALLFANSWAESMELHPESATKQDLKDLEKDLKIFFIYLVGGTLFFSLFIPIIQRYFGIN